LVRLKDELHGFRYDIEYNYNEYSDEKVYITLGFNIGVATKYFYINNKNAYTNNLAFANVFANYVRLLFEGELALNVDRTVTSISIGADKNTWTTKLMALFHIIFADSLDEKVFEDAHKLSLTRFEKAYKQGEFRAVYKAYEYADTNKGYKLHTLIEDIQNISFSDFLAARNNLVIPSNMCVYVNGCIGSVSDEERETINDWIVKNKVTAAMGGRIVDQRLKEDAHLLELSRQNVNMDILSLGFEENVSELDKMIYMVIEADKISGEGKTLHVDRFDSSIIVTTSEVLKLQNYLKRPATQQQFDMTREGLLGKYNQWLEGNPIRFNMMAVELKLNGTNIVDYIGTIANLTYQNYEEIAKKIRPIVSEAQIVMRRG
jgi:predicted Zn-dependent peptidase